MTICGSAPTVILIDDDPFEHRAFERVIKKCKLLQLIATFTEPRVALDFLRDPQTPVVDVIFLDLQMPTMTGFQFLDTAIASLSGNFHDTIVVILSSSERLQDISRSLSYAPVKLYLNKPLTATGLRKASEFW